MEDDDLLNCGWDGTWCPIFNQPMFLSGLSDLCKVDTINEIWQGRPKNCLISQKLQNLCENTHAYAVVVTQSPFVRCLADCWMV